MRTRQTLIRALTDKTKEWVEGDPELADILMEGKKTLEECIRYVLGKAVKVAAKNLNAMLNQEMKALPAQKIHGHNAQVAGVALGHEEVFAWAQEYYYNPDAKPEEPPKPKANTSTKKLPPVPKREERKIQKRKLILRKMQIPKRKAPPVTANSRLLLLRERQRLRKMLM